MLFGEISTVEKILIKATFILFSAIGVTPSLANETCQIVSHQLSLADFSEKSSDMMEFYFSEEASMNRIGKLKISERIFEIEFEEFRDVYVCTERRNDPCLLQDSDDRFIGEARIDKSAGVVVQIERQVSGGFNPFSRGGVADGGITIWKIQDCS